MKAKFSLGSWIAVTVYFQSPGTACGTSIVSVESPSSSIFLAVGSDHRQFQPGAAALEPQDELELAFLGAVVGLRDGRLFLRGAEEALLRRRKTALDHRLGHLGFDVRGHGRKHQVAKQLGFDLRCSLFRCETR